MEVSIIIIFQTFSSADYAFLFSFAQKIKETEDKQISFGVNAKVIHRKVGNFASAWGFGIDAGVQMHGERWHFGIVARDLTTTLMPGHLNLLKKKKKFYISPKMIFL